MYYFLLFFSMIPLTLLPYESIHDIKYSRNSFGDIFPDWQNIEENQIAQKLLTFSQEAQKIYPYSPVIIEIPHAKAHLFPALLTAHFTLRYANDAMSEWIIKNNSGIPLPFNAMATATVILYRKGKVLIVEETTRKSILGFPAGSGELSEPARIIACREIFEEVSIKINPEKLLLIALVNRTPANKYGASGVDHCYLMLADEQEPSIDNKEIIHAYWVTIDEICTNEEIQGLAIHPLHKEIAQHIASKCSKSYFKEIPNFRKSNNETNNILQVEFFQQTIPWEL